MASIIERQTAWKRSFQWLLTESTKAKKGDNNLSHQLQRAQGELCCLGWDISLHYQRGMVSSSLLSGLLSTAWLSDEHANMMFKELAGRLATIPGLASEVIIGSLAFQVQINNNAKMTWYTKQNSPLLYHYGKRIMNVPHGGEHLVPWETLQTQQLHPH